MSTLLRDGGEPPGISVLEADWSSVETLHQVAYLITELRPNLAGERAVEFVREAAEQGYRALFCRFSEHREIVAVAGFRVLATSRGRILMLEDLVVTNASRRRGVGQLLMAHLRACAETAVCVRVELDTAQSNTNAQRFYAGEGFRQIAVHVAAELAGEGTQG